MEDEHVSERVEIKHEEMLILKTSGSQPSASSPRTCWLVRMPSSSSDKPKSCVGRVIHYRIGSPAFSDFSARSVSSQNSEGDIGIVKRREWNTSDLFISWFWDIFSTKSGTKTTAAGSPHFEGENVKCQQPSEWAFLQISQWPTRWCDHNSSGPMRILWMPSGRKWRASALLQGTKARRRSGMLLFYRIVYCRGIFNHIYIYVLVCMCDYVCSHGCAVL